jgi:cytochrome bd-type quinol oxidase subunit 2
MLLAASSFGALPITTALVQSVLLSFVIGCRYEAMWEAGIVIMAALFFAPYLFLSTRHNQQHRLRSLLNLWPAATLVFALLGMQAWQNRTAGPSYDRESRKHLVWHEILLGMLSVDGKLIREYAGMDAATAGQYVWD